MTKIDELERAAKSIGVMLRIGCNDDDHYAVLMWRSFGPMIQSANYNRCVICGNHDEAMIVLEVAKKDIAEARKAHGFLQ